MKKLYFIIAFSSIFLGALIYVLWRPETLIMFSWFSNLKIGPSVAFLRNNFGNPPQYLPEWIIYSLPSALWLFAGILIFSGIWKEFSKEFIFWTIIFLLIAYGGEIGQAMGVVPGTFCFKDINTMIIANFVGVLTVFVLKQKKGLKNDNT